MSSLRKLAKCTLHTHMRKTCTDTCIRNRVRTFSEHIRTNVLGTRHFVGLCRELPRLTCVVYVSTAFSNCHLKEIDEKLYPLKTSPDKLIELYK